MPNAYDDDATAGADLRGTDQPVPPAPLPYSDEELRPLFDFVQNPRPGNSVEVSWLRLLLTVADRDKRLAAVIALEQVLVPESDSSRGVRGYASGYNDALAKAKAAAEGRTP
jgi:hypothetical protein